MKRAKAGLFIFIRKENILVSGHYCAMKSIPFLRLYWKKAKLKYLTLKTFWKWQRHTQHRSKKNKNHKQNFT